MLAKNNFPKGTLILIGSLIILTGIIVFSLNQSSKPVTQDLIAVLRTHTAPLQPFTLIDHNQQPFTRNNIAGKWSFLFFGYTHCPDVCPTTLQTLKQINTALSRNPKMATEIQTIFISVDPERDTPELLREYTTYFNKDFISASAPSDELIKFSKQFSAAYIKESATTTGEYLISHTSSIFLIDPKMRIIASFSPPHNAATITSQYLKIRERF